MYLVWDSGFFPLFSETRSPSFLADLQKNFKSLIILQNSIWKMFER